MSFVNYNGDIIKKDNFSIELSNRAFKVGDSIFETLRSFNGELFFVKDHFERLRSSLVIANYNIDSSFNLAYFEAQILNLISKFENKNLRIRFTVYRQHSGVIYMLPIDAEFHFIIEAVELKDALFVINEQKYRVGVYKEIRKSNNVLNNIKSNNYLHHSIAGVWGSKFDFDNVLLLDEKDNFSEATNANIYFVKGRKIYTPKLSSGCIPGIMRKHIMDFSIGYGIELIEKDIAYDSVATFEEAFITNSISGITPIDQLEEKKFERKLSLELIEKINSVINS